MEWAFLAGRRRRKPIEEGHQQRNIQLLKKRPWFDIPIVYTSGGRAILAMEKGTPGDPAFAEAFWKQRMQLARRAA